MPPEQDIPPPPKKHIITFGSEKKPQETDLSGVNDDINSLSRRVRMLEESSSNMRRFFQTTEENQLEKHKHISSEVKTINSDILELRKEIYELKDKFLLVVRELQTVARKEEVKVLEKYINLWNPVRFVTQNEIDRIIDEALERKDREKREKDGKEGQYGEI